MRDARVGAAAVLRWTMGLHEIALGIPGTLAVGWQTSRYCFEPAGCRIRLNRRLTMATSKGGVVTNRHFVYSLLAGAILLTFSPKMATAQRFVPGEDSEFPIVQFPDSLYSLNDRCIVRLRKLSLRMPAVYVNGLPIAFC
jgi:hypothetical protein